MDVKSIVDVMEKFNVLFSVYINEMKIFSARDQKQLPMQVKFV